MNTTNFNANVKNEIQLIDLIKTIDPFQAGDVYEIEYDNYEQTLWIMELNK